MAINMSAAHTVKVLEQSKVSPPLNLVPPTSIPLTFFDIPWLLCSPMKRIFFYEFPHPTSHFTEAILPTFKYSLSLALQHFFPLSGTLVCPPQPTKPHILYKSGDSVSLTIAESTWNDFSRLLRDGPKDVSELHPLVPQLSPTCLSPDTFVETSSLLAVQVTVFPTSGICIGVTFRHVVADGMALNHFIKTWASIFRSKGDLFRLDDPLPFYNRDVIEDPNGLEDIFLSQWWSWRSFWKENADTANTALEDKVRATLVIRKLDILSLKQIITMHQQSDESVMPLFHVSAFVVTCALVWVCLLKSQVTVENKDDLLNEEEDTLKSFCFLADCRNRLKINAPTTYFGNCLAICHGSAKKNELIGENGIYVAAKAIGVRVKRLENGVLDGAERCLQDWKELSEAGHLVTVAGSPKLQVYDTDFGWGRLKKTEVVHIDESDSISLSESRDEEGGIEVGLALGRLQMDAFVSIFEQIKNGISAR